MEWILIIVSLILVVWKIQRKLTKNFGVFSERDVPFDQPTLLFGHNFTIMSGKESLNVIITRFYNKFYNDK